MATKIFEIDRLPNFLRYGASFVHLLRAGAPLYSNSNQCSVIDLHALDACCFGESKNKCT